MKLVFATSNANKVKEIKQMLGNAFEIVNLKDIGCTVDIPETQATIQGNAIQKATYILEHYQLDCFSEDTGLEVAALDNAPGVYSARYAGPAKNADDNMNLLLKNLEGKSSRKAQFRTVIALILNEKVHTFEGIVKGTITTEKRGTNGFGYDPLFIPDGYDQTFGELADSIKNTISHRANAFKKLINFLSDFT